MSTKTISTRALSGTFLVRVQLQKEPMQSDEAGSSHTVLLLPLSRARCVSMLNGVDSNLTPLNRCQGPGESASSGSWHTDKLLTNCIVWSYCFNYDLKGVLSQISDETLTVELAGECDVEGGVRGVVVTVPLGLCRSQLAEQRQVVVGIVFTRVFLHRVQQLQQKSIISATRTTV